MRDCSLAYTAQPYAAGDDDGDEEADEDDDGFYMSEFVERDIGDDDEVFDMSSWGLVIVLPCSGSS